MLASRGYPTLDLAYSGEPDIPATDQNIRLEYFARALRWLGSQPGVNPHRLWVTGLSLGSEAAFLVAVHYAGLVHGVAGFSPNDVADCLADADSPVWTLGGKPVPCTSEVNDPHPTDNPAAVIPMANFHGPVFLDCGEADLVWSSCANARVVMAELASDHDSYPHELLSYPDAGHALGLLVPYCPGFARSESQFVGGELAGTSDVANPLARASQWPKLLAFLRN
jgi:hypothetical protein